MPRKSSQASQSQRSPQAVQAYRRPLPESVLQGIHIEHTHVVTYALLLQFLASVFALAGREQTSLHPLNTFAAEGSQDHREKPPGKAQA